MRMQLAVTGLTLFCATTNCQSAESLPEAPQSTIGYRSVAEALEALRSNANIETRVENGWTIAVDKTSNAIWSFAPDTDAAYPAVAKRTVVQRDGSVSLDMKVLCQASKEACDAFVRQFQALNARVRESMQKRR
jgi:hypothetical protein